MQPLLATLLLCVPQDVPTSPQGWVEWKEDHSRRKEHIRKSMSAADHLAALRGTGMLDALGPQEDAELTATAWTNVGPVGGFGSNLGYNGRVAGLRLRDDGSGGHWIFAGASGGGIWRAHSSNPGVWIDITPHLPNPSVRAFDIDPLDDQRFVVGTGDPERYKGAGFFHSGDGGWTWTPAVGPAPDYVYRLQYLPENEATLLAATSEGLLRSTDDGQSWSAVRGGNTTDLRRYPTNNIAFLAVQPGMGLVRTTTGGLSWSVVETTGLPDPETWGRGSLDACRDEPGSWVLLLATPNGDMIGVYASENGGDDWNDIGPIIPDIGQGQMDHAQAIAVAPDDADTIWVGGAGMAGTTNGGDTWTNTQHDPGLDKGHPDLTGLFFFEASGDQVLWITNDGGIYRHDRSGTNASWNGGGSSGLRLSQVDAITAERDGRVIGLQDNGELASVNAGTSWNWLKFGDGGSSELTDPAAVDFWCWVGVPWELHRSSGGGPLTKIQTPTDPTASIHFDPFRRKVQIPVGGLVYFAGADANPVIWGLETGLQNLHTAPGYSIQELFGSRADGATLVFRFRKKNDRPDLVRDLTVALWNGSGYSQRLIEDLAPAGSSVEVVATSREWPSELWVGFSGPSGTPKLLHSADGGATFEDWTAELSLCGTVFAIAPTAFDPDTVYAGTELGVFRTTNGGASWTPFQTGMPAVQIKDLDYVVDHTPAGTHRLVAATYGRGLWSRDVPGRPIVYVDKTTSSGLEDGSFEFPYDTLFEAHQVAPAGAILALRANDYSAPVPMDRDVKVVTWAGTSRVR